MIAAIGVTALLGLLYGLGSMSGGPLAVQLCIVAAITILVAASWLTRGRDYLSASTFLKIPVYIVWKLPIYARMLTGAEKRWNRTDRTVE
jgi:hypothetical protein